MNRASSNDASAPAIAWSAERQEHWSAAVVLCATDGSGAADGALRVAHARAKATGATLELLTVVQAEPVLTLDGAYASGEMMLANRDARRRLVEAQVARVLGPHQSLSLTVADGNPAYTISRIAIERRASMVVVGLGRHFIAHRLFGNETALQLARIARVPVLAVPSSATGAPRHAVVAIDFSEISTRAAQTAIETLEDGGCVDLVHVMPHVHEAAFTVEPEEPYERWAEARLATVTAQLVVPSGMTVRHIALRGRPAPALLDYASRVGADVISTGTHGLGFVARALLGSVTTKLLRGSTCTVLSVPRDPVPTYEPSAARVAAGRSFDAPLAWSRLLTDFTKRNVGRRTILEVDDLEIGAQSQEYNYPFLGASFSDRDGRLDLMLGDQHAGGRHLARTMGSIVSVDVLTDGAGHDLALRVQHGTSQTLLTFAQ
jgi:nucleotide-binding universal stress UspA family protein